MKYIFRIVLIVLILLTNSCGNKKEKITNIEGDNLEKQMIEAYNKGFIALDEGDVLFAAKNFNLVESLYPQSSWAKKSTIMAAYAYYSQNYYGDSIYELERFIKLYPPNSYSPYAYYLLGINYYETIIDEKKDIEPILKSKEYFNYLIDNYPQNDFALDAKYKLLAIENLLASKELYIAKYYIQKEKWIPALNRLKTIILQYDNTIYVEEALHRLVEVNYKIGLEEESRKYAKLLGYNYQSSTWYEKSYKVLNKQYEKPEEKFKKNNNIIIKNLKKLFK